MRKYDAYEVILIILTKFLEDRAKIVDFLINGKFWDVYCF